MNIHRVIRKTHYLVSTFILTFVLLYFVSGFIMMRYKTFLPGEPVVSIKTIPLSLKFNNDTLKFGKKLQSEYDLRGRMAPPITLYDGRLHYFFGRPGETHIVILTPAKDSIEIKTTRQMTLSRVMNRIHHVRGYKGGTEYFIWSVFVDLAAFSMILFAVTGILIWWKVHRSNRAGWIFLLIGFLSVVGVITSLSLLP